MHLGAVDPDLSPFLSVKKLWEMSALMPEPASIKLCEIPEIFPHACQGQAAGEKLEELNLPAILVL